MIWLRRGIVLLLSLVLLVSLLGTAFSTGFNNTVGKQQKIEAYIADSHLYDHFVAYVAGQAAKSEGAQSGTVSLNDASVQAAAKMAFPPKLIQQGINSFIDANYAWLEGKTSVPEFTLDLSSQKADFATRVGQIAKSYTAGLPVCTTAEAAREQINIDPLSAACRPAGTSPAAVGAEVTRQLASTDEFLSNTVITAASVNPQGNLQSDPYYVRASKLPRAYRAAHRAPYALAVLALVSAVGIVFAALRRRTGFIIVGVVLTISGVLLVASGATADSAVNHIRDHAFNNSSVGPLQQSLTDFAHRVASSLARTNLWFGAAFLIAAMVMFGALLATRRSKPKSKAADLADDPGEPEDRRLPVIVSRKRLKRPFGDSIMPLGTKPGGNEPEVLTTPPKEDSYASQQPQNHESVNTSGGGGTQPKPKRRKPPRLIQ